MRVLCFSCFVTLFLAACGADKPPADPASRADQATRPELISTTQSPSRSVDAIDQALEILKGKASISVRYDRVRTLDGGAKQRQVFVEMLGSDAEETDALAAGLFEKDGFDTRRGRVDENGIRVLYRKPGVEPINVLIRSAESGPPLRADGATSSLYLRQSVD